MPAAGQGGKMENLKEIMKKIDYDTVFEEAAEYKAKDLLFCPFATAMGVTLVMKGRKGIPTSCSQTCGVLYKEMGVTLGMKERSCTQCPCGMVKEDDYTGKEVIRQKFWKLMNEVHGREEVK